jgi:hypothetical protein
MAWTDERMDDLANRMDAGFARTDDDIRELRGQMHSGFTRVDRDIKELRTELKGDIDALRTVTTRFGIAIIVCLLGSVASLITAIATGALAG